MMHDPAPPCPGTLLTNIGTALREIAAIVARLEEVSLHKSATPGASRTLQDFDLTQQSLSALADLLDRVAQSGGAADVPALIAQIHLAWLRDILGGSKAPRRHDPTRIAIF
ncbi:MAG: chemotaxis protein [Loktanella sp.]|nr:chemotaxis protein [Loktanella sp.]